MNRAVEEEPGEDTDLAAFAREGPEVKTRGRLSAHPAELIHLQQKGTTCGYAPDRRGPLGLCPIPPGIAQSLPITSARVSRFQPDLT